MKCVDCGNEIKDGICSTCRKSRYVVEIPINSAVTGIYYNFQVAVEADCTTPDEDIIKKAIAELANAKEARIVSCRPFYQISTKDGKF